MYFYILSFWKGQKESLLSARCGRFFPQRCLHLFLQEWLQSWCPGQPCWLCLRLFFFLIPLLLNLELSRLQGWKELHQGYPASENRDPVAAQSDISSRVWESVPEAVPIPRQLQTLLKPHLGQPERQKNCTKSVILRYFKCFCTGWQQLPSGREGFSRASGKRAQQNVWAQLVTDCSHSLIKTNYNPFYFLFLDKRSRTVNKCIKSRRFFPLNLSGAVLRTAQPCWSSGQAPVQMPEWHQLLCLVWGCSDSALWPREQLPSPGSPPDLLPPSALPSPDPAPFMHQLPRSKLLSQQFLPQLFVTFREKKNTFRLSGKTPIAFPRRWSSQLSAPEGAWLHPCTSRNSGNILSIPQSLYSRSPGDKLCAGHKLCTLGQSLLSVNRQDSAAGEGKHDVWCPGAIRTMPRGQHRHAALAAPPSPCPRQILLLRISVPAGHTAHKAPESETNPTSSCILKPTSCIITQAVATWAPFSPCISFQCGGAGWRRDQRHSKGPRRGFPAQQHSQKTQATAPPPGVTDFVLWSPSWAKPSTLF